MNDRQEPNTPRDLAAVQAVNLVWFRDDLRTEDHPALSAAMGQGPTVGIYILDEQTSGIRPLGGAAKWWLHHALLDLHASLEALGVPLLVFRGEPSRVFEHLASQLAVNQVHWNRRYALAERELDTRIKSWLGEQGIEATSHAAWLLAEPWHLLNNQGGAYQVLPLLPAHPGNAAACSVAGPRRPGTDHPALRAERLPGCRTGPVAHPPRLGREAGRGMAAGGAPRPGTPGLRHQRDCRGLRGWPRSAGCGRHLKALALPALGPP
ncbi:deoxyribodipyrimidine photo-lyase [Arthrobacter sp. JCM 19049]|uniref:deoxyribodipyrimidine photo-lyase n=1 Tax=Arthrobacter sp. JCM 19049 TaxID=1460643 RepID=UPI0027958482|nr:deoxyribodipyrimidine photo-lyase [Arthrobacter sp. JCM 19049]